MGYRNNTETTMFNFSNEDYLLLLEEIASYFIHMRCTGFDDTVIRFDEGLKKYIASVYVLDYHEEEEGCDDRSR